MSGGSKITLLHLFHWRGRFKPRTVVNLAVFTLLMCGWRRDLQQQTLKEYLSVVSISWQMLLLLFSDTVLLWWLDRDRICHFVWFWSSSGWQWSPVSQSTRLSPVLVSGPFCSICWCYETNSSRSVVLLGSSESVQLSEKSKRVFVLCISPPECINKKVNKVKTIGSNKPRPSCCSPGCQSER